MPLQPDLEEITHTRTAFGLIDILGNYGGLKEGLSILMILVLGSTPEHYYNLKAIQKLFLAKTADNQMFARGKATNRRNLKRNNSLKDAVKASDYKRAETLRQSRIIKFDCWQGFTLLL